MTGYFSVRTKEVKFCYGERSRPVQSMLVVHAAYYVDMARRQSKATGQSDKARCDMARRQGKATGQGDMTRRCLLLQVYLSQQY